MDTRRMRKWRRSCRGRPRDNGNPHPLNSQRRATAHRCMAETPAATGTPGERGERRGDVRAKCCGQQCSGCQEWRLDELLEQRWPGKVRRGLALKLPSFLRTHQEQELL